MQESLEGEKDLKLKKVNKNRGEKLKREEEEAVWRGRERKEA
jgi:hypothetical protein